MRAHRIEALGVGGEHMIEIWEFPRVGGVLFRGPHANLSCIECRKGRANSFLRRGAGA